MCDLVTCAIDTPTQFVSAPHISRLKLSAVRQVGKYRQVDAQISTVGAHCQQPPAGPIAGQ